MAAILIVEDDLTFATMLKTWLGKQGFQISTAGDLSKAHKLLEHQSYDLILSDLRLPEGDGLSLLDWMQKHGLVVPLIVMTSYADVQNAVNAMKQGACDYIAKPVQPAMLLEKIEDALSASSPPLSKRNTDSEETQTSTETHPTFLEGRARRHANFTITWLWWPLHRFRYSSTVPAVPEKNMWPTAYTN